MQETLLLYIPHRIVYQELLMATEAPAEYFL